MRLNNIQFDELPKGLVESALEQISWFSIGLVGVEKGETGEIGALLGSGTLITVENKPGILTAYHVVDSKRFRRCKHIGLALLEETHHFEVPIDHLGVVEVARPKQPPVGPDLAVITVLEDYLDWLKAKKSFWSISPQRLQDPSSNLDTDNGLWVVCGFPDEYTQEEGASRGFDRVLRFTGILGLSGTVREFVHEGYDYLDVPVHYKEGSDLPSDFGGVSGGGLWKIPLSEDQNSTIIAHDPILTGVPFYQSATEKGKRFIRCHGPRSVYEIAYCAMKQLEQT